LPINIPKNLPAADILKEEKIFVMDEERARTQDIRPLNILILNLMPEKEKNRTAAVAPVRKYAIASKHHLFADGNPSFYPCQQISFGYVLYYL